MCVCVRVLLYRFSFLAGSSKAKLRADGGRCDLCASSYASVVEKSRRALYSVERERESALEFPVFLEHTYTVAAIYAIVCFGNVIILSVNISSSRTI